MDSCPLCETQGFSPSCNLFSVCWIAAELSVIHAESIWFVLSCSLISLFIFSVKALWGKSEQGQSTSFFFHPPLVSAQPVTGLRTDCPGLFEVTLYVISVLIYSSTLEMQLCEGQSLPGGKSHRQVVRNSRQRCVGTLGTRQTAQLPPQGFTTATTEALRK